MSEQGTDAERWAAATADGYAEFDEDALNEIMSPSFINRFFLQPFQPESAVVVFGAAGALLNANREPVPVSRVHASLAFNKATAIELMVFFEHFLNISQAELDAARERNANLFGRKP